MPTDRDSALREHLIYLLQGGGAHAKFEDAMDRFPVQARGQRVPAMPHTAWMLLEHMRLAQWDILNFSRDSGYKAMHWPKDYWPAGQEPPSPASWEESIRNFYRDMDGMVALIRDPETDLLAVIPWGEGQTILREALLVADHNAYHLGQLIMLRKMLGHWSE